MNYSAMLHGKSLRVEFSQYAHEMLMRRSKPLYVDIHLIFDA